MQMMQLFPDSIAYTILDQQQLESSSVKLSDSELNQLSSTVSAKRRSQFTLGRSCAHLAILKLFPEADDSQVITIGKNGEPVWPNNIVGSIAHSAQIAIAAVAFKRDFLGLGVDIEDLNKTHNPKILERIAYPSEIEWAHKNSDVIQATLKIFSAKEAIYKVLYPLVQRYFGFMAVELNPVANGFCCTLKEALNDNLHVGFQINIRQQQFKNYIVSATWLARI